VSDPGAPMPGVGGVSQTYGVECDGGDGMFYVTASCQQNTASMNYNTPAQPQKATTL
jgi:hypothetical protein